VVNEKEDEKCFYYNVVKGKGDENISTATRLMKNNENATKNVSTTTWLMKKQLKIFLLPRG
jgi:hypothetical protein